MKSQADAQASELNLTRKWRSKTFDQIVGQELCVRILKNSLYKGHYFPVYLFSGQRGCGKTTTARVFSAALNCQGLSMFQEAPQKTALPCQQCDSCVAMKSSRHPDFIEIDAASHTGVDNVRSLIENASFMPTLGTKKIYLIDEAHMLSKAAFNALLKILEEPPAQVLFILATTDPHKIIDTVISRCFQLFFKPIASKTLHEHLVAVCNQESIAYTDTGLDYIVTQTQGSARDALNLLEQVRFSSSKVTKSSVLALLGYVDDEQLIELFLCVLQKDIPQLLNLLQTIEFKLRNARYMWDRMLGLVHALLWLKFGVKPTEFHAYHAKLKRIAQHCSLAQLKRTLQLFYDHEQLFLKTTNQHGVLEMVLLQLAASDIDPDANGMAGMQASPAHGSHVSDSDEEFVDEESEEEEEEEELSEGADFKAGWRRFIAAMETQDDPLLYSIFQQGVCHSVSRESSEVTVEFAREQQFFEKWIQEKQVMWQPVLQASLNVNTIKAVFDGKLEPAGQKPTQPYSSSASSSAAQSAQTASTSRTIGSGKDSSVDRQEKRTWNPRRSAVRSSQAFPRGPVIDISDTTVWKMASRVVQYFPGTVTKDEGA